MDLVEGSQHHHFVADTTLSTQQKPNCMLKPQQRMLLLELRKETVPTKAGLQETTVLRIIKIYHSPGNKRLLRTWVAKLLSVNKVFDSWVQMQSTEENLQEEKQSRLLLLASQVPLL
jgi:hypothetical protein